MLIAKHCIIVYKDQNLSMRLGDALIAGTTIGPHPHHHLNLVGLQILVGNTGPQIVDLAIQRRDNQRNDGLRVRFAPRVLQFIGFLWASTYKQRPDILSNLFSLPFAPKYSTLTYLRNNRRTGFDRDWR